MAGRPRCVGEGGARGRTCNPLPGGFGHQSLGTRTGARGARWTQGQAGAGNNRSKEELPSATSQETWPEAEPRTTTRPLGENRGGAPIDVRLPYLEARPGPMVPANTSIASVSVLLPILSFVVPFVIAGRRPGNPCGTEACTALSTERLQASSQHGPPA